jgi:uncharacterized membrane protein
VFVNTNQWVPLADWSVTVTNLTTGAEQTLLTNASGAASFGLSPGRYRVCQTLQIGWVNTYPNSPCYYQTLGTGSFSLYFLNAPVPPDATATPVPTFTPTPTPTPITTQAEVTVIVATTDWDGLEAWIITVTNSDTGASSSQLTAANGATQFNLAPGRYQICQTLQAGWVNIYPNSPCYYQTLGTGSLTLYFLNMPTSGGQAAPLAPVDQSANQNLN